MMTALPKQAMPKPPTAADLRRLATEVAAAATEIAAAVEVSSLRRFHAALWRHSVASRLLTDAVDLLRRKHAGPKPAVPKAKVKPRGPIFVGTPNGLDVMRAEADAERSTDPRARARFLLTRASFVAGTRPLTVTAEAQAAQLRAEAHQILGRLRYEAAKRQSGFDAVGLDDLAHES